MSSLARQPVLLNQGLGDDGSRGGDGPPSKERLEKVRRAAGDLFVMHGECDRLYQHGIPEEPDAAGTRLSLTFRRHVA